MYKGKGGNNSGGWDTTNKSHFIMIPVEDQAFVEAYKELMNNTKTANLQGISEHLFQKDGKLHFTVCTLNIGEEQSKIDVYTNFLTEIHEEMKKVSQGGVTFNFDGFSTLGEGQNTRVVYVKMKEDENYTKLSDVVNFIITKLVAKNLMSEAELKQNFVVYDSTTKKYSITLHLTILNVTFLNKILKKNKEKPLKVFNSIKLLQYLSTTALPASKITSVNFCRMREDKKTERYEVVKNFTF
jgi:2'-5' RNA ligase